MCCFCLSLYEPPISIYSSCLNDFCYFIKLVAVKSSRRDIFCFDKLLANKHLANLCWETYTRHIMQYVRFKLGVIHKNLIEFVTSWICGSIFRFIFQGYLPTSDCVWTVGQSHCGIHSYSFNVVLLRFCLEPEVTKSHRKYSLLESTVTQYWLVILCVR